VSGLDAGGQGLDGGGGRGESEVNRPWGRVGGGRMEPSRDAAGGTGAEEGGGGGEEVSLREWLDRPGRAVEAPECAHVFRQVAEAVAVAHAQGVAVGSVRPSCFIVSLPFARVAFIESASGSDASGGSSCSGSDDPDGAATRGKGFPLRGVLAMELGWYNSPEEADDSGGGSATFASDVYRLGVLLFEVRIAFAFAST
jgi:serine/threonine protein kinase